MSDRQGRRAGRSDLAIRRERGQADRLRRSRVQLNPWQAGFVAGVQQALAWALNDHAAAPMRCLPNRAKRAKATKLVRRARPTEAR